jgi:hypothetical protein
MARPLTKQIRSIHRDETGAVMMFMLVATLILMLTAWALWDTGKAASTKLELQNASDAAAISQASIKARSMNMIAYTNIGKRSIFAIHSLYISHFLAYADWTALFRTIGTKVCEDGGTYFPGGDNALIDTACHIANAGDKLAQKWKMEDRNDFRSVSGEAINAELEIDMELGEILADFLGGIDTGDLLAALVSPGQNVFDELLDQLGEALASFSPMSVVSFNELKNLRWNGLATTYYAEDLQALDNYQRYMAGLTPWWAWTEQLVRGVRNGATTTVSYPRPMGMSDSGGEIANRIAGSMGLNWGVSTTRYFDTLPIQPGRGPNEPTSPNTMVNQIKDQLPDSLFDEILNNLTGTAEFNGDGSAAFKVEHFANLLAAMLVSDYAEDGAIQRVISAAFAILVVQRAHSRMMDGGLAFTHWLIEEKVGPYVANPWVVNQYPNEGEWLTNTSNLIYAYKQRGQLFGEDREKYGVVSREYELSEPMTGLRGPGALVAESIYRAPGAWTLSRSEISYQHSGVPDLWHPVWTSRIRPVALPDELNQARYSLRAAYHDIVPTLALTSTLGITDVRTAGAVVLDFIQMERNMRAMGPSTIEGVNK